MSSHSLPLNFCRSKKEIVKKKFNVTIELEQKCKWNSYVKCKQEKESHKKLKEEILTWTMNHAHCLTQKCQKLNQLLSPWKLASKAIVDDSH
jgi:hypothetical protein